MTSPSELRERVAALTGPDREVDEALAVQFINWCRHAVKRSCGAQGDTGFECLDCGADSWGNKNKSGQKLRDRPPAYTASTDAALALVERVLPNGYVGLDPIFFADGTVVWDAVICIPDFDEWMPTDSSWIKRIKARHSLRPLAIIAALLEAVENE